MSAKRRFDGISDDEDACDTSVEAVDAQRSKVMSSEEASMPASRHVCASAINLLNSLETISVGKHILLAVARDPATSPLLCEMHALTRLCSILAAVVDGKDALQSSQRSAVAIVLAALLDAEIAFENRRSVLSIGLQHVAPRDFVELLRCHIADEDFAFHLLTLLDPCQFMSSFLNEHAALHPVVVFSLSHMDSLRFQEMACTYPFLSLLAKTISHSGVGIVQRLLESSSSASQIMALKTLRALDSFDLLPLRLDCQLFSSLLGSIVKLFDVGSCRLEAFRLLDRIVRKSPNDAIKNIFTPTSCLTLVATFEARPWDRSLDEERLFSLEFLLIYINQLRSSLAQRLSEMVSLPVILDLLDHVLSKRTSNKPLYYFIIQFLYFLCQTDQAIAVETSHQLPLAPIVERVLCSDSIRGNSEVHSVLLLSYLRDACPGFGLRILKLFPPRLWLSAFVVPVLPIQIRTLCAMLLRDSADVYKDVRVILENAENLQRLGSLLSREVEEWHYHVIWLLRFASSGSERRKQLVWRYGCIYAEEMVSMLSSSHTTLQKEIAAFFKSLTSLTGQRKDRIFSILHLSSLCQLIESPIEAVQEHVVGLLRNLTHGDNQRKESVFRTLNLLKLIDLLNSTQPKVLQSVMGLLQNLCTRCEIRRSIICNVLPLTKVVSLLSHSDIRIQAPTAGLLMNLCRTSRERKIAIMKLLPMSIVVSFFDNGPSPALREQATGLSQHLRLAFLAHSKDALLSIIPLSP